MESTAPPYPENAGLKRGILVVLDCSFRHGALGFRLHLDASIGEPGQKAGLRPGFTFDAILNIAKITGRTCGLTSPTMVAESKKKIFFAYKCKLSLSLALLYLVDLFINKLKTKFNNLFLQNDFKYKKNLQLLLKKFPRTS